MAERSTKALRERFLDAAIVSAHKNGYELHVADRNATDFVKELNFKRGTIFGRKRVFENADAMWRSVLRHGAAEYTIRRDHSATVELIEATLAREQQTEDPRHTLRAVVRDTAPKTIEEMAASDRWLDNLLDRALQASRNDRRGMAAALRTPLGFAGIYSALLGHLGWRFVDTVRQSEFAVAVATASEGFALAYRRTQEHPTITIHEGEGVETWTTFAYMVLTLVEASIEPIHEPPRTRTFRDHLRDQPGWD